MLYNVSSMGNNTIAACPWDFVTLPEEDQSNSQLLEVLRLSGTCFPQNCPFPFGDRHPHVTLFLIIPNGISIGSTVFVWVSNAMLHNASSVGKNKISPSPWNFVTLPEEEDRATAVGNMYKMIKIARVVQKISSRTDRHTQTDTQTCSSQYFETEYRRQPDSGVLLFSGPAYSSHALQQYVAENFKHKLKTHRIGRRCSVCMTLAPRYKTYRIKCDI